MDQRRKAKGIVVLCEGDTEEIAIRKFIRPQLNVHGLEAVGLDTINLEGKLEDVFKNVVRFRTDPKVIGVFALIDLYEMKRVPLTGHDSLAEQVRRACDWLRIAGAPPELKQSFKSQAMRSFYHPHLSVHEVEAWLLADTANLTRYLRLSTGAIKPIAKPEQKDSLKPPKTWLSELLQKHGRQQGYDENITGGRLFQNLDFATVYAKCDRYFRRFYDDLKEVAQKELNNPDE